MLEAELFSFLEQTSDAGFVVTELGEIRSWNKSAERLFGYMASEALSRTCSELLDGLGALGERVCAGDCSVQHCAAEHLEIPDFDLQVKIKSGARLWVNVSTIVYHEPRRNRLIIVHLARDISRRKKHEELRELSGAVRTLFQREIG